MTKSIKTLILVIGILSILSGVFLALTGSDFLEYFLGIFAGVALLIGVVSFSKEESHDEGKTAGKKS